MECEENSEKDHSLSLSLSFLLTSAATSKRKEIFQIQRRGTCRDVDYSGTGVALFIHEIYR